MKTSSSPITLPAIGCCSNTMDTQTLPDLQPEQHPARKGKVARKSKTVRDRINQMMCDGVPYPQILSPVGST